jgi:hypothetical protein
MKLLKSIFSQRSFALLYQISSSGHFHPVEYPLQIAKMHEVVLGP